MRVALIFEELRRFGIVALVRLVQCHLLDRRQQKSLSKFDNGILTGVQAEIERKQRVDFEY